VPGQVATTLSPRLGLPILAAPAVRGFASREPIDLVHAWGIDAVVCAASAFAGDKPIVVTVSDPGISDRDCRALQTVGADRRLVIACAAERVRRRLVERGVPYEACAVVRPGVDFAAIRTVDRHAVRTQLGLSDDANVFVIPPPLDDRDGHYAALWSVLMRWYLDGNARILVPGAGREIATMRRLAEASEDRSVAIFTGRRYPVEQLIVVADWLVIGDRADIPMTAAAWAMAANTITVAPATYATSEILSNDLNARLFKAPNGWRRRAARLCALLDDAPGLAKIREVARGQAYEVFSIRRYCQQTATVYSNVLEQKPAGEGIADPAVVGA
jgi:glycosyltransferase involved in cell wall biosynthesis